MTLAVVSFIWADPVRRRSYQFSPEHVGILQRMVARNLSREHKFVCVTPEQIDLPGVQCVKLDETKHVPGTCFVRLMARSPNFGAAIQADRVLMLDLDMVITGSLDPLVDRDEPSVFWRNPNFQPNGQRAFYQGSVQLFTPGSHSELWTEFDPVVTPQWVNRRFGGAEQAWISERLPWDLPHWTAADGIYGAGRLGDGVPGVETWLPPNARIVSFPGNRIPSQPETQAVHPWIKEFYRSRRRRRSSGSRNSITRETGMKKTVKKVPTAKKPVVSPPTKVVMKPSRKGARAAEFVTYPPEALPPANILDLIGLVETAVNAPGAAIFHATARAAADRCEALTAKLRAIEAEAR